MLIITRAQRGQSHRGGLPNLSLGQHLIPSGVVLAHVPRQKQV
jgi:hypothetical protein